MTSRGSLAVFFSALFILLADTALSLSVWHRGPSFPEIVLGVVAIVAWSFFLFGKQEGK